MTQCETCINLEPTYWHVSDAEVIGANDTGNMANGMHFCLPFGEPDGIPTNYWEGEAKCPYHMKE
jgi:hypothetical protein